MKTWGSRARNIGGVALAIASLGSVVAGCFPWGANGDPARGSICAAAQGGAEHCVPSDQGPDAAWSQAHADGKPPIQMWAKWPASVSLDQLARNENGELSAWFRDVNAVQSYVRGKDAESYRATLAGNLGALLQQVAARQAAILGQALPDPIGKLKKALADKAKAEKDPLVAETASDKMTMAQAQAVIDKATADSAPLSAAYASLAADFTAYRTTEPAETSAYAALAQQASAASLADVPGVEQAISAAATAASSKPAKLAADATALWAQIQAFEKTWQAAIAPYRDFMATHGAAVPDVTSAAQRSLASVQVYVKQRTARSHATAASLLAQLAMRKKALEMLAAPNAKELQAAADATGGKKMPPAPFFPAASEVQP
jgi:hypothetical protein